MASLYLLTNVNNSGTVIPKADYRNSGNSTMYNPYVCSLYIFECTNGQGNLFLYLPTSILRLTTQTNNFLFLLIKAVICQFQNLTFFKVITQLFY